MTDQMPAAGLASDLEAFSHVSAVHASADGKFNANVSAEWTIGGRPNGGYLVALLGRAASALTESAEVVAASAHYLRSPAPGPVEIEGEVLRRGRSVSQARARMTQEGRPCVEALVSTSELDQVAAPRWDTGVPMTQRAPFDECIRMEPVAPDGSRVPMLDHIDLRLDPESSGILRGRPSGRGRVCGWLKLVGEESFDPVSLLYAVDALPPATFDTDFASWASTVELTVYVRAIPAPGPVWIMSRARLIDPLWVDETCDVWDGTGRLVAQATQLARVPLG